MSTKDSVINLLKAVVTVDFLSSIEASELFCNALVGKSFELVDVPVLKSKVDPAKEIPQVKYQGKHRSNTWFLGSFLKNATVVSAENGVDCPLNVSLIELRRKGKFATRFTVEGFEPSVDQLGNAFYSKQVTSELKVRKLLRGEMMEAWLSREYSDLKIEATNLVRANYSTLFRDDLCTDGKLNKQAEDIYRLGTIKLRVAEVVELD